MSTREIKIPEHISTNQHNEYLEAELRYNDTKLKKTIVKLSEQNIYYIAVVAYFNKNLKPLRVLNTYLKREGVEISDKYFWIYLSKREKLFYSILEVEMYRRRTTNTVKLLNCSDIKFDFQLFPKQNTKNTVLDSNKYKVSENNRCFNNPAFSSKSKNSYLLNVPNTNWENNLSLYFDSFIIQSIVRAGGVIAGGFVNSIVNPVYNLYELKLGQNFSFLGDIDTPTLMSIRKCVENWFIIKHRGDNKKYDIKSELLKHEEYLYTDGEKIYTKIYQKVEDIDVFFYGDDYKDKVKEVVEILLDEGDEYRHVTTSDFATTFHIIGAGRTPNMKIQIIKRAYTSVEEILCGFDLDSSRIALIQEEGEMIPVATQSYIDSVNLGINCIVPSRQSLTFNRRLIKYNNRGFVPYVPLKSITINAGLYYTKKLDKKLLHTLEDLKNYAKADAKRKHSKCVSDYERDYNLENPDGKFTKKEYLELRTEFCANLSNYIENPEDEKEEEFKRFFLEKKMHLHNRVIRQYGIKKGWIEPTQKDVLYLANSYWLSSDNQKMNRKTIAFAQFMTSIFWIETDPGTQYTGSFNPTSVDYLASTQSFDVKPANSMSSKILHGIIQKFGKELGSIIAKYFMENAKNMYIQLVENIGSFDFTIRTYKHPGVFLDFLQPLSSSDLDESSQPSDDES